MRPYKTNSPEYLNYVARNMDREAILADPNLCVLLNEPSIKENMEIALLYQDAQWGDLQDKINFVEYFFCNGPELDTNTILYYRTKIIIDDTYSSIAQYYFQDMDQIDKIRETKYGKETKNGDCFSKPCNYLGRFSDTMGLIYDQENSKGSNNQLSVGAFIDSEFAKLNKAYQEFKKTNKVPSPWSQSDWQKYEKNGALDKSLWKQDWEEKYKKQIMAYKREHSSLETKSHLYHLLVPSVIRSMFTLKAHVDSQQDDHLERFDDACMSFVLKSCGDPYASQNASAISLMGKANIKRKFGDCARLWEWSRQWQAFNPTDNAFTTIPVKASQVGGSKIDGQPVNSSANAVVKDASISPDATVRDRVAGGDNSVSKEWVTKTWNKIYAKWKVQEPNEYILLEQNDALNSELDVFVNKHGARILGSLKSWIGDFTEAEKKALTAYYKNVIQRNAAFDQPIESSDNDALHTDEIGTGGTPLDQVTPSGEATDFYINQKGGDQMIEVDLGEEHDQAEFENYQRLKEQYENGGN